MATTSRKPAPSKRAAVVKDSTAPAAKKAAPPPSPPPAAAAAAEPLPSRPARPKQKLVRDSFTMPKQDFELIDVLKQRMGAFGRPARKSDLLRAGLQALMMLPDARLAAALDGLTAVKPRLSKKDG